MVRLRCCWPTDHRIALGLIVGLVILYCANGDVLPGNDATPNVYLALNVLQAGRLSFTPSRMPWLFDWQLRRQGTSLRPLFDLQTHIAEVEAAQLYADGIIVPKPRYFMTPSVRTDPVSGETLYIGSYGPGAGLSAVPILAFARVFVGDLSVRPEVLWYSGKVAAALFAAASAGIVFLTCRLWLQPAPALVLALAYGLGTCVWSVSSQTLWQHAPNEFFLTLGTFFLVHPRGSLRYAGLSGLFLGAAAACRPTSALLTVVVGAYMLVTERRRCLAFIAASLPFAVALGMYNSYFLGSLLHFGQTEAGQAIAFFKTGSRDVWQTPMLYGLAGLLVSPSRGLLVFSPFLALALWGAVLAWRRAAFASLRPITLATVLLLAVESRWFDWWGGWGFGYRRIVDLVPMLVVLIVPTMGWVGTASWRRVLFGLLVSWSVCVQVLGAYAYDLDGWNAKRVYRVELSSGETVVLDTASAARQVASHGGAKGVVEQRLNIDRPEHRDRLWSLRDNQIGYYLAHFTEARQAKTAAVRQWLDLWRPPQH